MLTSHAANERPAAVAGIRPPSHRASLPSARPMQAPADRPDPDSALLGQLGAARARLCAYERAMDSLRSAVLLLDADACVQFANRRARRLIDDADGLCRIGRRLGAMVNGDAARLREAVAAVAGLAAQGEADGPRAARTLTIRRRTGRPPLLGVALPAATTNGPTGPSSADVLLFIVDPGAFGGAAAALLRDAFGLTSREAGVALAAVRLASLPAAAEKMGVALTTARSHLQHVFDKTGARNQVALAQMLAALGALPLPQDGDDAA